MSCIAIKESAFEDNPLPIIVSLEVHADPDQQEVMVQIMKEEWGDLLLDQPYQGCDPRLGLPRLEELQKKILIKVKKAPSRTNVPNGTSSSLGVSLSLFEENGTAGPEDDRTVVRAKKVKICDSLGKLAIYTHSEHFESFDDRSAKLPSHIFSLDENDISALNQTKHLELFRHNRTFFMRAYPSARHMDSSNPDPSKCWRKGVQMVALNWQTLDEAMMLNSAMFEGENGLGLETARVSQLGRLNVSGQHRIAQNPRSQGHCIGWSAHSSAQHKKGGDTGYWGRRSSLRWLSAMRQVRSPC